MGELQFNKGDIIIKEGDSGTSFYRILEGTADVVINYGKDNQAQLVTLEPGNYFGEIASLEGTRRTATVIAAEDNTKVFEVEANQIDAYLKDNPDEIIEIMKHLGNRIRSLTAQYEEVQNLIAQLENGGPKTESMLKKISLFTKNIFGVSNETDDSFEKMMAQLRASGQGGYARRLDTYDKGTIIFREDEPADCMYAIQWGSVGIYTKYGTPDQLELTKLFTNDFFGEMGMINNTARSATAVVLEDDTTLEIIYMEDLIKLYAKNPNKIYMIMAHTANRLRRLTEDFNEACAKLATM